MKRSIFTVTVMVCVIFLSTLAWAQGKVELPKTGQTTSYATGDDGDIQAGVAWPDPRFTDNLDGTVTDNLTGLTWLQDANCSNATRTWTDALTDVAQLNTDGTMNGNNCGDTSNGGSHQTDWRLPNMNQLKSLVHAGQADSSAWMNTQGFINVQSNIYWASTTCASDTDYAWIVDMHYGHVYSDNKTSSHYVWPVRAEISPEEAMQDLISDVENLNLPAGIENSLVSKLENAIKSLNKGNENATINKLNAFINQVEAQKGKKITDEEADQLIAIAQLIIDNI